jgi:hypothetical protein
VTTGAGLGFGGSGFFSQPMKTNAATMNRDSRMAIVLFKWVTSFRVMGENLLQDEDGSEGLAPIRKAGVSGPT